MPAPMSIRLRRLGRYSGMGLVSEAIHIAAFHGCMAGFTDINTTRTIYRAQLPVPRNREGCCASELPPKIVPRVRSNWRTASERQE